MILITGHVILTPEHRERMIALGVEHSARSRAEPGCLAHHCHIDAVPRQAEDGSAYECLTFVEEWESVDAVRAHFALPAARAFRRRHARPLAAAARDPHLCRRGYDGEADGVNLPSRLREGLGVGRAWVRASDVDCPPRCD
ncbi:putative quinol monooxygenase [Sphingopyxis sp. Q841]|uniref:putative quinol monooxygenase n=1 Tax=Sphingopyxis sp. Q841 TaxID=3458250 RepID=UPI004036F53E